jgi:hypothetical protein
MCVCAFLTAAAHNIFSKIVLVLVARTALHSLAHTISSARARVCVSVCVGSLSSKASDVPAICVYNICARWNKNRRCNHVYVRHTHPLPEGRCVCVHVRAMSCREAAVGDGRSRNTLCACARASAHTHTKTHYLSILLFFVITRRPKITQCVLCTMPTTVIRGAGVLARTRAFTPDHVMITDRLID